MALNAQSVRAKETGPSSAVIYVSGCIYISDCRSRSREFDPTRSNTFVKIDREITSTVISDSRWVVVSYKRKYVHEVLVNSLVKLAQ